MTNVPRAAAEMGRAPATPTQQHKPAAKNNVVPRSASRTLLSIASVARACGGGRECAQDNLYGGRGREKVASLQHGPVIL